MNKLFYFFILCFYSLCAAASSLSFDVGETKAIYNRFAIPNNDQNRISLPIDDSLTSFRVTGYVDLDSGNQIYFLLAPLSTSYNFVSTKNFEFDNESFLAGADTDVSYKFNSYRLGYLWNWKFSNFHFWTGLVGKIRDAKIEVKQAGKSKAFENIGFVPLAAIGAQLFMSKSFSLFSHTDALAASQGSAFDSQLEARYHFHNLALSIGKRILGGGADNDRVYNFAEFATNYLRLSYLY